jgi:hypothetical protein
MISEPYSPEFGLLLQAVRLDDVAAAASNAKEIIGADRVNWEGPEHTASGRRLKHYSETSGLPEYRIMSG